MSTRYRSLALAAFAAGLAIALVELGSRDVLAHCDGLDGPVVKAAERASIVV